MTVDASHRAPASVYEVGHFINGRTIEGASGRWGDIAQPATGELQGKVAFASNREVDDAIAAPGGGCRRADESTSR